MYSERSGGAAYRESGEGVSKVSGGGGEVRARERVAGFQVDGLIFRLVISLSPSFSFSISISSAASPSQFLFPTHQETHKHTCHSRTIILSGHTTCRRSETDSKTGSEIHAKRLEEFDKYLL